MPKRGKIYRRIFDDQSGNTYRRGCSKDGIDKTEFPIMGERERKKQGTDKNDNYEAEKYKFDLSSVYDESFRECYKYP